MTQKFTLKDPGHAIYTYNNGFSFGECDALSLYVNPLNDPNKGKC